MRNFKQKLDKKFNLPDWNYSKISKPTFFFGLYHWKDYMRFALHRSRRIVFWCGSDILNLNKWNNWIFKIFTAQHYCENKVEYLKLLDNGIVAEIKPLFLGNVDDFPISYKQSDRPQVWLCMHPGREKEYGLDKIKEIAREVPEITFHIYGLPTGKFESDNIIYHGIVPEEQFNEEIKNYQGSLRCNSFDGFSEIVAKSILLGQYPISRIEYTYIDSFKTKEDLIYRLEQLKYKKEPNYKCSNYWRNELKKW